MLRLRSRRRLLGFTLLEVMAATAIMSSMYSQSGGAYRHAVTQANQMRGIHNLKQLHMLIQMQSMMDGLPKAVFYPEGDPRKDPNSIVRRVQGAPPELFVSPFAPEVLQKRGLTYAWNSTVNGKDLSRLPRNTWLLIDLAAFSADPRIPKPDRYLVLYADGRAEAVDKVPADIAEAVAKAHAELERKQEQERQGQ